MSLNQVLWYATPDSPLIATLEMDGWSFEDGGYTPSIILPRPPRKPHPRPSTPRHPGRRRRVVLQHRPGPPPVDLQSTRLRRRHHLGDRHRPLGTALVPLRGTVPVLIDAKRPGSETRGRAAPGFVSGVLRSTTLLRFPGVTGDKFKCHAFSASGWRPEGVIIQVTAPILED